MNLREGETYTLTATATSVEGTKTATLDLGWGCDDGEVADGEVADAGDGDSEDEDELEHSIAEEEEVERIVPVINETEFRIPVVPDECGQRYVGMGLCNGCAPAAGDTENNRSLVGYMSFNISSLVDVTVNEATLELRPYKQGNTSFFGNFYLNSIYWGPKEISEAGSVLSSEGIIIGDGYPSAGSGTITCTHGDLKREIQKAINDGKPRFQIRIHFSGSYTDNDNSEDSWTYMFDNINLTVEYSEN